MKTVLITGSSSGIGHATAKVFQVNGWRVIATMRNPEQETELTTLANVHCIKLDVTQNKNISTTINGIIENHQHIDVLVNNAGYGLVGALECASDQQIEDQIRTNIAGLMLVTKAVLPHMRSRKQGTIINLSSIAGKVSFPFYSSYNATKWAVEGFSEALQYELAPFNIYVKVIEPGLVETNFFGRSLQTTDMKSLPQYASLYTQIENRMGEGPGIAPERVAQVIYQAAISDNTRLRYPVGRDAKFLLCLRKILGEKLFQKILKYTLIKNL